MSEPESGDPRLALRFDSARDTWLVVLMWASVGVLAASMAPVLCAPLPPGYQIGTLLLTMGAAAFMLWVLYGTYYLLEGDALRIRSGPFRWRVPLDRIVDVTPSNSPLSSPACSLDRLRIRYAGSRWGIMISPEQRTRFLQALAERAPQLRIEGDSLSS